MRGENAGRLLCLFGIAVLAGFLLATVPQHRLFQQPNMRNSGVVAPHVPLVEFAGDNGLGMSTACACTGITGSTGQTSLFARASNGTCFMNSELTGIQPGELVTCATDQPRVQYGGTGAAPLGISIWEAKTNSVLRNQEVDNVAWLKGAGANLTTVEANVGLAPDGTTTADRMLSKTGASYIEQVLVTSAVPYALSWFVSGLKTDPDGGWVGDGGVGVDGGNGTGTIPICGLFNGNTFACSSCTYPAYPAYVRCSVYITSNNNASTYPCLGGGCAASPNTITNDVLAWGAQIDTYASNVVPSVSPYIPTAGTPVTRAVETFSFDAGFDTSNAIGSFALTMVTPNGMNNTQVVFDWYASTANFMLIQALASDVVRLNVTRGGVSTTRDSTATVNTNATNKISALVNASTDLTVCVNSACDTSALTTPIGSMSTVFPGNNHAGAAQINATVKKFCADNTSYCE